MAALTLQQFAVKSIEERIAASDPTNGLCRFANYAANASKDIFTPNTNFWLRGVDFSCVSPWNSAGGRLRAGTAISKRHVVFAKHFPIPVGTRIVFVSDNDASTDSALRTPHSAPVCPCYIEATKEIDDTDIMIGLLNAELTPNIHPAKILPPDYEKYIGDGGGIPVVTFNQHENAFLTYMTMIFTDPKVRMLCGREPSDPKQKLFRRQIIVGDSGDPAFLLIGNHPILLYCLYGGGCGSGHALHRKRYQIQAAMDELCPGYTLEVFDFKRVKSEE